MAGHSPSCHTPCWVLSMPCPVSRRSGGLGVSEPLYPTGRSTFLLHLSWRAAVHIYGAPGSHPRGEGRLLARQLGAGLMIHPGPRRSHTLKKPSSVPRFRRGRCAAGLVCPAHRAWEMGSRLHSPSGQGIVLTCTLGFQQLNPSLSSAVGEGAQDLIVDLSPILRTFKASHP